jgi:hypothetical protein
VTFPAETRKMSLAALLLLGCSHSDPSGPFVPAEEGPLTDDVPARLTYSPGTDVWPNYSQDGNRLIYTYERGTADHDRCLGVLPSRGGQRVAEVCATGTGQNQLRDGFEHGALSNTGWLAYTKHSGNIGGPSVTQSALYVAPLDSLAGIRKVFDLGGIAPGAQNSWDYLLHPVWISDTELAFMGTRVEYIPPAPFADPDTVYFGLDIAKVRIDGGSPQVTVLASLNGADAMAYDPSAARFVFLRGDSLFTVPVTGGSATFYATLPETENEFGRGITGVAAGGGKIWITWIRTVQETVAIGVTTSSISEVSATGALTSLNDRERRVVLNSVTNDEGSWHRITAAPDGTRLAIEGQDTGGGYDVYLLELP